MKKPIQPSSTNSPLPAFIENGELQHSDFLRSKRILLFANTDWYLYNFRLGLAERLRRLGCEVVLAAPDGKYRDRIVEAGFRYECVNFSVQSMEIREQINLYRRISKVIADVRPDLVHHFTIKCILFGGLAASRQQIPSVHSVTGLGHLFVSNQMRARVLRRLVVPLYRYLFHDRRSRVIFQNCEDRDHLARATRMRKDQFTLIRGSGADCNKFVPSRVDRSPCKVLFASRLLHEKGVFELLRATDQLKADGVEFQLIVAGEPYPGNPSSLTESEIGRVKDVAQYLGHVDDMPSLLEKTDIVVLPSHHEGTPRILLEAGAAGKPLIATDIAGCRGVVVPGRNGYLVPVGSVLELSNSLRELIENPLRRIAFGKESRQIVLENFSEESVIERTIEVYRRFIIDRQLSGKSQPQSV